MHSFRCQSHGLFRSQAPVCFQQKETVFVLGCSSGAPQTESTVLWPFSKRDHLSPELGPATPALAALVRQKGTCRVDVAQQASRINHHLFPSAHIPPSVAFPAACCLPCNLHTNDSLSAECTLSGKKEKERKQGEEKW